MSDETKKVTVTHLFLTIASDQEAMDDGPYADFSDQTYFLKIFKPLELLPEHAEMLRITAEYQRLRVHLAGSESVELAFVKFNLTPYWARYTRYKFVSFLGELRQMN